MARTLLVVAALACRDAVTIVAPRPEPVRAAGGGGAVTISVGGAGDGAGTVASSPTGVTCYVTSAVLTGTCWETYSAGDVITLTATPAGGSLFLGWTGACTGNGPCHVTLAQATTVIATFMSSSTVPLSVSAAGSGIGTVSSAPAGITCYIAAATLGGTCWASFAPNQVVTLTATSDASSTFLGWTGACTGTGPCQVTMAQAASVTASFLSGVGAPTHLTIGGAGDGTGTVTSSPAGVTCYVTAAALSGSCWGAYAVGRTVTLTAAPHSSSLFIGWTGACAGTGPTCVVSMSVAQTVVASFGLVTTRFPMAFGPYGPGQDPNTGIAISESQIRARLQLVWPFTRSIRTYSMTHGLEAIGRIGHELGMQVACGAWLGRNAAAANEAEIVALIAAAQRGECDAAIVGNEVLLRHDLTETELVAFIERVKAAVPSSVRVTTAETYDVLERSPAVLAAVQAIYYHAHPYWEGVALQYAVARVHAVHQHMLALAGGRTVVLAESGWPACGSPNGAAVPSPANASAYLLNLVSWARATGAATFLFEALSEEWKAAYEPGGVGACWGVLDATGWLRPGMAPMFLGASVADNWSGQTVPGGPGTPQVVLTSVPSYGSTAPADVLYGQVWHVRPADTRIVVYIRVSGGWWVKPTYDRPTTAIRPDGSWACDIVTGGSDEQATEIAAYLIPATYAPPVNINQPSELAALQQQALAVARATRAP